MKAIFLDVDGVLNRDETEELSPKGLTGIEDCLVYNLYLLVDYSDAKIILSSDWKNEWEPEYSKCGLDGKYLVKKLEARKLSIYDKTDDSSDGSNIYSWRGVGIKRYLKEHPEIDNYVILDDKFFEDFDEELLKHLVYMENYAGFTGKYLKHAAEILGGYE